MDGKRKTRSSLFASRRMALSVHLTLDGALCCAQDAILLDVCRSSGNRMSKAQPGQREGVVQAVERVHRTLERDAWHQGRVEHAVKVPPGRAQIALAVEVCVDRPRIVAGDVRASTACRGGRTRRWRAVQRTEQGSAIAPRPVVLVDVGVGKSPVEHAVLLMWCSSRVATESGGASRDAPTVLNFPSCASAASAAHEASGLMQAQRV